MPWSGRGHVPFLLVYVTLVLDNVLLTVVVPLVPAWIGHPDDRASLSAPTPLNATVTSHLNIPHSDSGGAVWAGVILSSRSITQLLMAGVARRWVTLSPRGALCAGTAALTSATLLLAATTAVPQGGAAIALAVVGRVVHGAGSALAGVAGLARADRQGQLPTLLSATAIGVLVGYPLGGASAQRDRGGSVLLLLAAALAADTVLQHQHLEPEEYDTDPYSVEAAPPPPRALMPCVGAIALCTGVLALLEPCLPPYLRDTLHPQVWVYGLVFVSDSVGYFLATTVCASAAQCYSAAQWSHGPTAHVATLAQAVLSVAAVAMTFANSIAGICVPQLILGACVGALDAVLVPALLHRGRCTQCDGDCFADSESAARAYAAKMAASVNAASAAAYAIGPSVGGLSCSVLGLRRTLWATGGTNALYALYLYTQLARYPLTQQCGHDSPIAANARAGQYLPLK